MPKKPKRAASDPTPAPKKGLRKAVPPADDPGLRHGAHPPDPGQRGSGPARRRAKATDETATAPAPKPKRGPKHGA